MRESKKGSSSQLPAQNTGQPFFFKMGEVARAAKKIELLVRLAVRVVAIQELAANRVGRQKGTCLRKNDKINARHTQQFLDFSAQSHPRTGTKIGSGIRQHRDVEIRGRGLELLPLLIQ